MPPLTIGKYICSGICCGRQHLSKPNRLSTPSFAFNQILTGQEKAQTPRWQRASELTDSNLGELLGQLYVEQYFKPAAKARMDETHKEPGEGV